MSGYSISRRINLCLQYNDKIRNKILNMFLDVLEFEIQNKQKMIRENCFENLVSDWWKNEICVYKTTFRKKC